MEESPTLASVVGDKPPNSTNGANGASTSLGDSSDPEKSGLGGDDQKGFKTNGSTMSFTFSIQYLQILFIGWLAVL